MNGFIPVYILEPPTLPASLLRAAKILNKRALLGAQAEILSRGNVKRFEDRTRAYRGSLAVAPADPEAPRVPGMPTFGELKAARTRKNAQSKAGWFKAYRAKLRAVEPAPSIHPRWDEYIKRRAECMAQLGKK